MAGGFNVGTVYGDVKLETSGFKRSVSTINKGQTDMASKSKKTGSAFKGMWKQMAVGMGVTTLVTSAIRGMTRQFSDTIQKGIEFGREWANVTTMLSISEKETKNLRGALIDMSPTLGDVTSLAKGMYQVLSASIEPAKAIEFLGVAAKAAKAGVTDIATSVDALTTVINAYGMEADEATNVSDIMFATVKRGKLTFGELAQSLGTVAPVAGTIGIKFEEVAAAIASLTRQGIPAATATMQLRQVFMAILKPSDQAIAKAKELGIEWTLDALKAKGLGKFLLEVKEKTEGNVKAMADLVPNVRALTGVMALAGRASEGFAEDLIFMANASGLSDEAFMKQMKTAGFWIDTYKNQITKMKVVFFEAFVDNFKLGIKNIEEFNFKLRAMTKQAEMTGKMSGRFFKTLWGGIKGIVNATTAQGNYNKMMELAAEESIRMEDTVKTVNKVIEKVKGILDKATGGVRNLTDKFSTYNKILKLVEKGELKLSAIVVMKLKAQKELIETYGFEQKELKALLSEYGSYTRILDAVKNGNIEVKKTVDKTGESTEKLTKKIKLLETGFKALKTPTEMLQKEIDDFKNSFAEFSVTLPEIPNTMDDVMSGLIQGVSSGSKQMQAHIEDMEKEALRLGKKIKIDWEGVADDMGRVWAESFQGMMDDTETFADFLNSTFDSVASGVSSIVGGLLTKVLGITGKLAGPIGAIFSSIIAGALGMFKKLLNIRSKAEKEAEDAAAAAAQAQRQLNAQIEEAKNAMSAYGEITDATAEKMAELRKTQEGYVAESLVFADVIKDVGVNQENLNLLWEGAIKVLSLMNDGQISLVEGSAILDDAFTQLKDGAIEFGQEGSDAMINFILKVREAGIEVASVTSYINDQLGVVKSGSMSAAEGLQAMAEHIPVEKVAELFKEQKRLLEEMEKIDQGTEEYEKLGLELAKVEFELENTAQTAHEMASDLEGQALRVFNAMIANGASYNEAMASLGPTLDIINQAHKDLGIEGGVAIQELLHIRDVTEENKSLFNAIDGNVAVLTALKNTGNLTEEALLDSAKQASRFYDEIVAAGLTGDQALAQMAPTLQILADEAEKYGYKLDDNTQSLIDQAKDMGLVTEAQEDEQDQQERLFGELGDRMAEIMEKLAASIEKSLGRGFGDAFDSAEKRAGKARGAIDTEFSGMSFDIGVGYKYAKFSPLDVDGKGSAGGSFQGGTAFIPSGPTPIMVHSRELVDITPLSELSTTGRSRAGLEMSGSGKTRGDINISINNTLNVPSSVNVTPQVLMDMLDRNEDESTRKIAGFLERYQ